jgi:hypothetical protein
MKVVHTLIAVADEQKPYNDVRVESICSLGP